jgi:hypothetical protein
VTTRFENGTTYTQTYDLEGHQTLVTANGHTNSFIFNGDRQLVAQQVDGLTTAVYVASGLCS